MNRSLTEGPILKSILLFTGPLLIGNILQQLYNMVDTYVVGKALGKTALAAVGSSYSLMTFLISIITGLCLGSSALTSIYYGSQEKEKLQKRLASSFLLIGGISLFLQILCHYKIDVFLQFLNTPSEVYIDMRQYIIIVFQGILFLFFYNFFAYSLRALGNSFIPILFLSISTIINILLDVLFVMQYGWGIEGVAYATLIAQMISAITMTLYCFIKEPIFHIPLSYFKLDGIKEIMVNAFGASIQQSIMNFGILLIQGLVNTFGPVVMAAFTIGVKIDSLAYMPVQEFGNSFSTFVAQNYGAGNKDRIKEGIKKVLTIVFIFSVSISCIIFLCSHQLISIFSNDAQVIGVGVSYLRIEGSFYLGIGILFFFYGYYRAIKKPEMSILLTIVSLGTRVLLSYSLSKTFGYTIIWASIPIGWFLADCVGYIKYKRMN